MCLELNDEHRLYPENLDFKEFKKMIVIDDFISTRLNTYIKCFEQALTAYLIVTLSEKMISKGNNGCNDYSLFDELLNEGDNQLNMLDVYHLYKNAKISEANDLIVRKNKEVIEKIINLGTKKMESSNYLYKHYKDNYELVPIWVVLHQLSLGELQTIFNLLKIKDRVSFVERLYHQRKNNRFISSFSNKINYIRLLRNSINHYEPIIPFIHNLEKEDERKRLMELIKLLKLNYYSSSIHDNSKVNKPKLDINVHRNNADAISYLRGIIKIV